MYVPPPRPPSLRREGHGLDVFHNMSAPPRATITLRPLKPSGRDLVARSGDSASGLKWVMRIDLEQLIRSFFPTFDDTGDQAQDPNSRLHCCLLMARVASGVCQSVGLQDAEGLRNTPFDQVCDELRELSAAMDSASLQLPPLALVTKANAQTRPVETNASRVFYALSRLNGTTFVRSGLPMITGLLNDDVKLDLWLPT